MFNFSTKLKQSDKSLRVKIRPAGLGFCSLDKDSKEKAFVTSIFWDDAKL